MREKGNHGCTDLWHMYWPQGSKRNRNSRTRLTISQGEDIRVGQHQHHQREVSGQGKRQTRIIALIICSTNKGQALG